MAYFTTVQCSASVRVTKSTDKQINILSLLLVACLRSELFHVSGAARKLVLMRRIFHKYYYADQIVNMTGKYFPAAPSSRCLVNATDSDGRWSLVGQGQCVWKSYQTDFFI